MKPFTLNKKDLIILVLLLAGLGIGLFLVQKRIAFQSQADEQLDRAVEVQNTAGNPLNCDSGTCQTESLDINVKVDLNQLIQ